MKRLFKVSALAILAVFFMTGCGMKAEYGITIEKDGNVKLDFVVAEDNEMIDMEIGNQKDGLSSDDEDATNDWLYDDEDEDEDDGYDFGNTKVTQHTDQERWEYLEAKEDSYKDFKKVRYEKDEYKGFTYTLNLGKIENLVNNGDKVIINSIDKDSKIFAKEGNTYKLNIKLKEDELNEINQYSSMMNLDLKVKVTLPTKAKSNNATSVDGNTYTWDLTKTTNLELAFELNNNNMMLYCGIGAAIVLVAVVAIFCVTRKSKNKNVPMNMNMPNNNMPM